jgi:D-alanyl-D-alanine carboxypeptidase
MAFFSRIVSGGRWSVALGVSAMALSLFSASMSPAEAARKRHRGAGYNPPYASLVIDAKTGRTLHAVNENALRHPASITKVMTLYMLFEQMERGRFRMDSPLRVSAYAASRPPSKIGVDAGDTIEVEDAIKALITKSANDVAVVVAENIAGSEEAFAEQMTRRARSLGMSRTVFRNASGLPDKEQVTTARDLTILARAIQERFPRHYGLFQTRSFNYAGRSYRNHNKLLGRIEGVDGIKTGYTRMSGFNLMTSAKADGRQIVSIVLGGRSGAVRDRIMADLVVSNLPRASAGPRTTLVAQLPDREAPAERVQEIRQDSRPDIRQEARPESRPEPIRVAAVQEQPRQEANRNVESPAARPVPRPIDLAAARTVAASTYFAPPTPGSTSQQAMRWATGAPSSGAREIRPPATVAQAALVRPAAAQPELRQPEARPAAEPMRVTPVPVQQIVRPPAAVPGAPAMAAAPAPAARPVQAVAAQPAPRAGAPRPPANVQFTSSIAKAAPKAEPEPAPQRSLAGGWMIQLGATDEEGKARSILSNAKARSPALSSARGFTQSVEHGGSTLFRARFAGFGDQSDANNACRELKRSGFACFATRT